MKRWLGAAAVCLACQATAVSAQTVEVAPFEGYRFGGDSFERVTSQPVDLDGTPAVGGVVNVAMHDGLWFEGLFTRQDAVVNVAGGSLVPSTRWRVTVDHWLAGGLQEFGQGRARPFLTGLLGLTRYAAEGDNEIRFVVRAGGGIKLRPVRHLGVRLDSRIFATFARCGGARDRVLARLLSDRVRGGYRVAGGVQRRAGHRVLMRRRGSLPAKYAAGRDSDDRRAHC